MMNRCRALRILLVCIMCMAPSASMHVSVYPTSYRATYSKQLTGHEIYIVYAGKWLVGSGVHPPPTHPPHHALIGSATGGGVVFWHLHEDARYIS